MAVQDDLFRFGLAHGLRHADAAEATQETFLRAYRQKSSWRPGSDAMGWMYGIAMNVVREFRRRNSRRAPEIEELDAMASTDCQRPDGRRAGNDGADAQLDKVLRKELVEQALTALPPRQQEAVSCRYLLEMSLSETSAIMGCAEGTVKAAVFAALENLRKILKQPLE